MKDQAVDSTIIVFYQYPHPVKENILIHSKQENNESIIEIEIRADR